MVLLNFGKTTLGRVSFLLNYYYIVIVRYARPEEKQRFVAVFRTWSYGKDSTLLVIDLCAMINPFDQADKKRLYNIATGKAAFVDTEQFLLSVNVRGDIAKIG